MTSGPIISWQIEKMCKTVKNFTLLGSKITVDSDWSHELRRYLLLGKIPMMKLDRLLKSKDVTLPTKVLTVKTMFFPVVMYGYDSWTIKKAECRKIDAFELWCWRTLESPLDSKEIKPVIPKGNQPWIFIGRTDAEAPILWPPDTKSWLIGKDPDAAKKMKAGGKGGWQRIKWLDGSTNSIGMSLSKLWIVVKDRKTWCAAVHWITKSWT